MEELSWLMSILIMFLSVQSLTILPFDFIINLIFDKVNAYLKINLVKWNNDLFKVFM